MAMMTSMPASTVPNTVSNASGLRTIPSGSRCNSRSRTIPPPTPGRLARTSAANNEYWPAYASTTPERAKSHGAYESENAEPPAIEGLVGQHRQGVRIGDAAKFAAAAKLVDCIIEASEHLRRLRRTAQHEMDVGGEA